MQKITTDLLHLVGPPGLEPGLNPPKGLVLAIALRPVRNLFIKDINTSLYFKLFTYDISNGLQPENYT